MTKLSILGGHFMVSCTSVALVQLRNPDRMGNPVTLQYPGGPDSSVVEHLVQFQKGLGSSPCPVTFHAAINPEVTQVLSRSIQNLIEGEMKDVIQVAADDITIQLDSVKWSRKHQNRQNTYLQKSYFKTESLMARALCAIAVLGRCVQGDIWREVAYAYG